MTRNQFFSKNIQNKSKICLYKNKLIYQYRIIPEKLDLGGADLVTLKKSTTTL